MPTVKFVSSESKNARISSSWGRPKMPARVLDINNGFFKVARQGSQINIFETKVPRGKMVQIMPRWDNSLPRNLRVTQVLNSGNAFITADGQFSALRPASGGTQNLRGQILGQVVSFDP